MQIEKGTRLIYQGDPSPYYTVGSTYEVDFAPADYNGWYNIRTNGGNSHMWDLPGIEHSFTLAELPHDGTVAMDAIPATQMSRADEVRAIVTEVFSEPGGLGVGPVTGLSPDELLQELDAREHEPPKPAEYWDQYRPKAAPGYEPLFVTLLEAHDQAAIGKGRARHANGKPFLEQPIMEIGRMVGVGYQTGQAMKKSQEASGMLARGNHGAAKAELLGAINYLAAAYILIEEQQDAAMEAKTLETLI